MIELLLGGFEPPKQTLIELVKEPIIIEQPVIELTIEEKIEQNVFNCDESIYYIRADDATCLAKPVYVPISRENTPQTIRNASVSGSLIGSYGSVRSTGNCVNEPGVNSPGRGNPITWAVTSNTPTIGATALWNYNHTGLVVGIYEGGEYIEVRHQNFSGNRTKFHISEFRGFR